MSERIVLIGADTPALDAVIDHIAAHPGTEGVMLYPENNPVADFSCGGMGRFLGLGIDFPERPRAYGVDTN